MKIAVTDIGGTEIKYGVFDADENFFDSDEFESSMSKLCESADFGRISVRDDSGKENILARLKDFLEKEKPDRLGISIPGPFDYVNGISHMKQKLHSIYEVKMADELKKSLNNPDIVFMHDAVSFMMGTICEYPKLKNEDFVGVMLGTGLGFAEYENGRVLLNECETPLNSVWNKPYKDGICEDYVSATALINNAKKMGYDASGVKELADAAYDGDKKLVELFRSTGCDMGHIIDKYNPKHNTPVVGGQVSKSWSLFEDGFKSVCDVPVLITKDPEKCALYGILRVMAYGKDKCCTKLQKA